MKIVYFFISIVLVVGVLFIERAQGKGQPNSDNHGQRNLSYPLPAPDLSSPLAADVAAGHSAQGQSEIRATSRISIPFGITPILSLHDGGEKVVVNGHGGCTADEMVSVVISVTQTTGATAVGQTEETCTGLLQHWTLTAATTTTPNLDAAEAEACGRAVTRSDGVVTDSFDWCRDVALTFHYNTLPIIHTAP